MSKRAPFVIGLTGSVGMGKTTTARMFADEGAEVWDADAAVARLYARGGAAVDLIGALHPRAVRDGAVDRTILRQWIAQTEGALGQIEALVHPLVADDRAKFLAATDAAIVVLDIPLLFETGGERAVDLSVVVSAPPDVQRARVLARPGMNEAQLALILSRQMPDAEKRARADVVIPTLTLAGARAAVQELMTNLRKKLQDA
jgi:dephospho-CoA kinase